MKTPHMHAAMIVAWSTGEEIEYRMIGHDNWSTAIKPTWETYIDYRIKPEPKPDIVRYGIAIVKPGPLGYGVVDCIGPDNLNQDNNIKLTFDGETNKLIKVELV